MIFINSIIFYIACLSFLVGAFSGIKTWIKWYLNTSSIFIKPEMLQPIVNATFCAGTFIFYTVGSGICSTFIGVSFPISVPMLIYYNKKNGSVDSVDISSKIDVSPKEE